MYITLIAYTTVKFNELLQITKTGLDRSITKSLDAKNIKCNDIKGYICALGEFVQEDTSPDDILKDPGILLNFINATFLLVSDLDTIFELQNETGLRIITSESKIRHQYLGILNGSILQYREAIINGLSCLTTISVRKILNDILIKLETEFQLMKLFQNYTRKDNKDGTFLLV